MRAELGMHPLKTARGMIKLKGQYKVRNRAKRGLPAIVDRAA